MFSKYSQMISGAGNPKFYLPLMIEEEVQSGYLYKSPPPSLVFRNVKSWKRRYFVLYKSGNMYELKFFKDENKKEKPIGKINIQLVSLLFLHPDSHPVWSWIEKNFRCSASCVLFMKVLDREYFLIGENREAMESWFDVISAARNTHIPTLPSTESDGKPRSISEPLSFDCQENTGEDDQKASTILERHSTPESFNSVYDVPRSLMMIATPSQEMEDNEMDEGREISEEHEAETNNCYMEMRSVRELVREFENEVTQTNPVKKDICLNLEELKNSVKISEEAGRLCVSDWRHIQSSGLFHKGDQILAINDLLTESLDEMHTYLRRLSKDQVKLTILRQPGSRPLNGCCELKT